MKKRTMKMAAKMKTLSFILCSVLIVAMALITTGCSDNAGGKNSSSKESQTSSPEKVLVLGQGHTMFEFSVVDKKGNETFFEIHTDKTIVGEALQELDLIQGEDGQYGLYVKTVSGITADYDKDGMYWAFYVNGEYALSGVDTTEIKEGERYSFKIEKS